MKLIPFIKSSSVTTHFKETDGNVPYFVFSPNLDEPSLRKLAAKKYLSLYPYCKRPKKDVNTFCVEPFVPAPVLRTTAAAAFNVCIAALVYPPLEFIATLSRRSQLYAKPPNTFKLL